MSDRVSEYASDAAGDGKSISPGDGLGIHLAAGVGRTGNEGVSTRERVRALVIYHHAFLRDLVAKVLSVGGVEVVAAVRAEDLDGALLNLLKPQVLVMDQAALELDSAPKVSVLLSQHPDAASRVVLVDMSNPNLLVWQRQLVADADIAKLLEAVLESVKCTRA